MSVNIFGFLSAIKRYVDNSKFITLTKAIQTKVDIAGDKMTGDLDMNNNGLINIRNPIDNQDCVTKHYLDSITRPINRQVQLKVNADGDTMHGNLDMDWHTVTNIKFPLNSCDATNKLYVQICTEPDEIDVEKLCKIGEIISLILNKYESLLIQYIKKFSSSLAYAISMYSKYKTISGSHASNIKDISNCTIFVDLKVNIIKIIEVLPKNIFMEVKNELKKENLLSTSEQDTRKRFRRFLTKCTEQTDSGGPDEQVQLLLHKNLLLIDIGFVYLIDSLLHILLVE